MPIIKPDPSKILPTDFGVQPVDTETPKPSSGEVWGAAFNTYNTIGSTIQSFSGDNAVDSWQSVNGLDVFTKKQEGYNPYDEADIESYSYADQIVLGDANNTEDYGYLKKQLAQRKEDRQILSEAGGEGIVAGLVAGTLDPLLLVPMIGTGSKIVSAAKAIEEGTKVAKFSTGFVRTAPRAAAEMVPQQIALQATDPLHTTEESAMVIGGSAILAGTLGGAMKLLSKGEASSLKNATDDMLSTQLDDVAPQHQAGGAQAVDPKTVDAFAKAEAQASEQYNSALGINKISLSAEQRLSNSMSENARIAVQNLTEVPTYLKGDAEGIGRTPSLVSRMDELVGKYSLLEVEVKQQLRKYNRRAKKEKLPPLTIDQFSEQVSMSLRRQGQHELPEVEAVARGYREKLFDPMLQDAIDVGELTAKQVKSYTDDIVKVEDTIAAHKADIKAMQSNPARDIKNAKAKVTRLKNKITKLKTEAGKVKGKKQTADAAKLQAQIDKLEKQHKEAVANHAKLSKTKGLNKKLTKEIKAKESEIVKANKELEKLRTAEAAAKQEPVLPEGLTLRKGESWLKNIYSKEKIAANPKAFAKLIQQWVSRSVPKQTLLDIELTAKELAEEIVSHIEGSELGRTNMRLRDLVPAAKSFKDRVIDLPIEQLEPFLENDITKVAKAYVHDVAPRVEMRKMGLDPELKAELNLIKDDYQKLIDATTDVKEIAKLKKRMNRDMADVKQIRDEIFGTFGSKLSAPLEAARTLNHVTMLGGMGVTSITDGGMLVAQYGLGRFAKTLYKVTTNWSAGKAANEEMKKMYVGLELENQQRTRAFGGYNSANDNMSTFASRFTYATGVLHWTQTVKRIAGIMTMDVMLAKMESYAAGTLDKATTMKISRNGISRAMALRIVDQVKKYGTKPGGIRIPNIDKWDDAAASLVLRSSIRKHVDMTINTPKAGMLPSWTHKGIYKLGAQFKSFMFASHLQALIPALQVRDGSALQGMIATLLIGYAMSDLKSKITGRDIGDTPPQRFVAALNEVGPFALVIEANNISDSMFGYSMQAAVGAPSSFRNQARDNDPFGAAGGATASTLKRMANIASDIGTWEFDRQTLHNMRVLTPYQNLFYARQTFDRIEETIGDELNLAGSQRPYTKWKNNLEK